MRCLILGCVLKTRREEKKRQIDFLYSDLTAAFDEVQLKALIKAQG